ncbi:hypothetical protein C9I98_09175 [Photobacterium sanctipauli]|uniref:Uncharacterized protein n=1 Tax=Photobacterium sanctipauli TaxID=1342794 RepID=A0A2T3NVA9_9GAMM|nr:hypothetical protein [Photobacterium sanctipauli]PSW20216.1 hypothetical protein C9I98_09175 [Photobacterium sanctipauli]
MSTQRRIRPNLTNYDVVEIYQQEIRESEARLFRKILIAIITAVLFIMCFIGFIVTSEGKASRDYAAEAMQKAFETERAIHIIDEAAGTNFLQRAKDSLEED